MNNDLVNVKVNPFHGQSYKKQSIIWGSIQLIGFCKILTLVLNILM